MSTNFYVVVDNAQTTVGAGGYTAGAGSFPLASGYGATLAGKLTAQGYSGAPSATQPVVFSTFDGSGNPLGVYAATGLSTDTLTGVTLLGGTDTTMAAGGTVAFYCTAEHIHQITKVIPPNMSAGASGNINLAPQAAPGTPTNGDFWSSSTQVAPATYQGGLKAHLVGCFFSQAGAGTTASSTSNTNMLASASSAGVLAVVGTATVPANRFQTGTILRIRASGHYSNDVASNPLSIYVKLGGTVVGKIAATLAVGTNKQWAADVNVGCIATGVSGSFVSGGALFNNNAPNNAFDINLYTLDTTGTLAVTVEAQFTTADAGTTCLCNLATLEFLN